MAIRHLALDTKKWEKERIIGTPVASASARSANRVVAKALGTILSADHFFHTRRLPTFGH